MEYEKKVELIGVLKHPYNEFWNPEDYSVSGAMGCFAKECSSDIHKEHAIEKKPYIIGKKEKTKKLDWEKTKELILRETSGRGHGAVLDQEEFSYSIDNLSRASTLFLCGPEYGEHLQQSLRRASAERGFWNFPVNGILKSNDKKVQYLMKKQFELYEEMQSSKIPSEDARFILPLNTKTAIQTKWNARELMHLYSMSQRMNIPLEVKDTIEKMYSEAYKIAPRLMKDRKNNLEVLAWRPSPQLFAKENSTIERLIDDYGWEKEVALIGISPENNLLSEEEIDRAVKQRDEALLSALKHYHFTFLAGMSLATFHQATRQRTWHQSVQALPNAVRRAEYIIPPSIQETKFRTPYKELTEESIEYVKNNLENPEVLGVIPHSLKVYDLIHIDGWNAIHSIGKRTCTEAQWEIRNLANAMADKIREYNPNLGKWAVPQGVTYGDCPEKNPCGNCYKGDYNTLREEVKKYR